MIEIRQLQKNDWQDYRAIRPEALKAHPDLYSSNYAKESEYTNTLWQDRLTDKTCGIFGLYDGSKIIGLTGVITLNNDPKTNTAIFVMSYIHPDYRGQGHAQKLYKARINCAVHNPDIHKIQVSHQEGNQPSKAANQKAGFQFVNKNKIMWPDGQNDWQYTYMLDLQLT
jgi:RimJ/RimL family protein N-acetyltransferase